MGDESDTQTWATLQDIARHTKCNMQRNGVSRKGLKVQQDRLCSAFLKPNLSRSVEARLEGGRMDHRGPGRGRWEALAAAMCSTGWREVKTFRDFGEPVFQDVFA